MTKFQHLHLFSYLPRLYCAMYNIISLHTFSWSIGGDSLIENIIFLCKKRFYYIKNVILLLLIHYEQRTQLQNLNFKYWSYIQFDSIYGYLLASCLTINENLESCADFEQKVAQELNSIWTTTFKIPKCKEMRYHVYVLQ